MSGKRTRIQLYVRGLLLLQNYPRNLLGSNHLQATIVPLEARAALLDLRFVAEEIGAQMFLTCEYRLALYSKGRR